MDEFILKKWNVEYIPVEEEAKSTIARAKEEGKLFVGSGEDVRADQDQE